MEIFEEMDTFGLVSSILEIFAEESTQIDYDKGRRVWVESGNAQIIKAANEVFENCMVEERVPAVQAFGVLIEVNAVRIVEKSIVLFP